MAGQDGPGRSSSSKHAGAAGGLPTIPTAPCLDPTAQRPPSDGPLLRAKKGPIAPRPGRPKRSSPRGVPGLLRGGVGQLTVPATLRGPVAEETPHSGNHGGGRKPAGREPELRSRNDTAGRDEDGDAPEAPSGSGETADSPGASSERRKEVGSPTAEESAQSNAAETECGLPTRPRPAGGRPPVGRPGDFGPRAGNGGTPRARGVDPIPRKFARTGSEEDRNPWNARVLAIRGPIYSVGGLSTPAVHR
jgi:hypothetical protein